MGTEIERKWIVPRLPRAELLGPGESLRQGYLARDGVVEVRVRTTTSASAVTIKAGVGMSRTEVETEVSSADAEALWPYTAGRRVEKVRHRVGLDTFVAEVDVYGDRLAGLYTVEVEFPSEADAASFDPPEWFGREVTGDARWSNASLAEHGLPD